MKQSTTKFTALLLCLVHLMPSQKPFAQTFGGAYQHGGINSTVNVSWKGIDASGNIMSILSFTGIVDVDPGTAILNLNASNGSFVLHKLAPSGILVSALQFNLPPDTRQVVLDAENNVYATGAFSCTIDVDPGPSFYYLTSAGYKDIFVLKLDNALNFSWAASMGGPGSDEGRHVATAASGQVYITGVFGNIGNTSLSPTADFDPDPVTSYILTSYSGQNGFICALDANGAFAWAQNQSVSRVETDNNGNVYLLGILGGSAAPPNTTYFSKMDAAGNGIWSKQVANTKLELTDFTINNAGEVLFSGGYNGSIFIGPYNLSAQTIQDPFYAKLDNTGNVVWAKNITGNGFAQHISYAVDGNLYMTGYISSTGNHDFDPGPGTAYLNSKGNMAAFIEKLSSTGQLIWVKQIGGETKSHTRGRFVLPAANGDIFTFLTFSGTVDFDPNGPKFNLTSKGTDFVVHKLTQTTTNPRMLNNLEVLQQQPLKIYSTMNNRSIRMKAPETGNGMVRLYDMAGKLLYQQPLRISEGQVIIIDPRVAKGSYVFQLTVNQKIYGSKFLIQ